MKFAKIGVILFFIEFAGYSQTIINAERLSSNTDSTSYALSFSYNGTRGNSVTDILDIAPAIVVLKKANEFKIFGGYSLLSQSGTKILNSGFVHLRHNYKINEHIRTFEFYQLQFNNVLLLDKREIIGAGLRFTVLNKDSISTSFNAGIMRELEILNGSNLPSGEILETRYYRATIVNSFKYQINKAVRIDNVVYYQPYLKDFGDYRLLNDLNLSISISEHLKLITALSTRYDSQPPSTLKKLDNILSFGINIKL